MNTLDKLTIYNQALTVIGVIRLIESLTESSQELRVLDLFWDSSIDQVLQEYEWNFATRYLELTELTGVSVEGWNACYTYPSDCLKCQFIMPTFGVTNVGFGILNHYRREHKIPFDIFNIDSQTVVIVTNIQNPTLVYTTRITNLLLWNSKAITALKYYLASQAAAPLAAAIEYAERVGVAYQNAILNAGSDNNNESYARQEESEFILARR